VTNRTDLYSLGAVLFTLLARRPPFTGANLPQVFHKLRHEEAPSVRRYVPEVPAELDLIIQQLLKKDPNERIPTALALSNRLRAMQHALSRSDEELDIAVAPLDDRPHREDPTRLVEEPGCSTEVAPTAIVPDPDSSSASSGHGNDATLLSFQWPSAERADKPSNRPTVAEKASQRADRFSWRDETESDSETEHRRGLDSYLSGLGLAAALLGVVGLVVWATRPLSADALHQRILRISRNSEPRDAEEDMKDFLRRFPHDPRAAEVKSLLLDGECQWLQKRLAIRALMSGGSKLEPHEKELLAAMRKKPATQPADPHALQAYQQSLRGFLEQYGAAETAAPPLDSYLKAARHLLERSDTLRQPNPQPR